MDGAGGYHTNGNKPDRERHISHDVPYIWNLNELIYTTATDSQT